MFTFWRIPQCFISGGFRNVSFLEGSSMLHFRKVPKRLDSGGFRSVSLPGDSEVFRFWRVPKLSVWFLESSEVECLASGEFRS